ncbi:MAG: hypothetical protein WED34_00785 [Planctomycetales bacterium]
MRHAKPRFRSGRIALSLILAAGLSASAAWRHVVADEDPAETAATDPAPVVEDPAPAEEQPADGKNMSIDEDLRDKVEVYLLPKLRTTGRNGYYITARIKNISDEKLAAPIRLAVLGTKIDGLEVRDADGSLDGGQPFFELIDEGKGLAPGARSEVLKVVFDSQQRLTAAALRGYELQYRVTREGLSYADRRQDQVPQQVAEDDENGAKDDRPLDAAHPDVRKIMQAQQEANDKLLRIDGVSGTGIGLDPQGRVVMKVYIARLSVAEKLPAQMGGVPLFPQVMPQMRARYELLHNGAQAGNAVPQPPVPPLPPCDVDLVPCNLTTDTTIRIGRPAPLGSEIQNIFDFPCFVGTLGARVTRNGNCFFLSNNHVIGGLNLAFPGEDIVQPGCYGAPLDTVGHVADVAPVFLTPPFFFPFFFVNRIDAAIASAHPFRVDRGTPCIGYGTPISSSIRPALGMKVQKFGRTTHLTKGVITDINVFVLVFYGPGVALFRDQIFVSDPSFSSFFSLPGDSGSLVVTDPGRVPVGLLFAGGGGITVLNEIDQVLDYFNIRIDGECP